MIWKLNSTIFKYKNTKIENIRRQFWVVYVVKTTSETKYFEQKLVRTIFHGKIKSYFQ